MANNEIELLKKVKVGCSVWFYTYDGELHEGWVDTIECTQRNGWTVSMHYKPEHKTGSVYTARIWTHALADYGKYFALTKGELKNGN